MSWLRFLVGASLAWSTLAAPTPAQAVAGFTFDGLATEQCFGCGPTSGSFTGTLTGTIDGHVYYKAPLTYTYTSYYDPAIPPCSFSGRGSGTMQVSDGTRTDYWDVSWARAYYSTILLTFTNGSSGGGGGIAAFVPLLPTPIACYERVTADMRGFGFLA